MAIADDQPQQAQSVTLPLGNGIMFLHMICGGPVSARTLTLFASADDYAQWSGIKLMDDAPGSFVPFAGSALLPATIIGVGANHPTAINTAGHRFRASGTLVFHHEVGPVTTVVYDMLLSDSGTGAVCNFRGTAVAGG